MLLRFPAERIEPDPRLVPAGGSALHAWMPGFDALIGPRRALARPRGPGQGQLVSE
ncbi:hypothetical protein [Sorangium sp. So ce426]|uniref:hypothetical protein n=1 Tax=unclassified Sorangium TaxID=2621164 RepID=UPI003F5C09B0